MIVHLLMCEDWEALYVGWRKVDEGHSLSAQQILPHVVGKLPMGCELKRMWVSDDTMKKWGYFFPDVLTHGALEVGDDH